MPPCLMPFEYAPGFDFLALPGCRLIDFGMCKQLQPSERTFTPCGTPEYIAPEVITKQAGYY